MIDVHEYSYAIFLRHEGRTISLSFTMKTRQVVFRRFSNFNIFTLYDEKAIYWHTMCERGKKLCRVSPKELSVKSQTIF